MWASGRERVDRAFEAVEDVTFSAGDYLKRLVILIFANFAFSLALIFRTRTLFAQAKACPERTEEIEILFEVGREEKFFARLERKNVTADYADAADLGGISTKLPQAGKIGPKLGEVWRVCARICARMTAFLLAILGFARFRQNRPFSLVRTLHFETKSIALKSMISQS
jgi:hypothetical protein